MLQILKKTFSGVGTLFERTADSSLVLLDDLQQLHARSLDGVEDLQSRGESV